MNQAQRGAAVPGAHSYSSSTVMHYSSMGGEGSSPRIYQASTSTRRAPGGVSVSSGVLSSLCWCFFVVVIFVVVVVVF